MPNPWLAVPLEEYEGHMNSTGVEQLTALAELFKYALDRGTPKSVAVLGVAGGNGLEHVDRTVTKRIVGVDFNQRYLDAVQQRFGTFPGIELHCCDLAQEDLTAAPVELVHAALIFEHAGLGRALENALSLVAPGGRFSVVLQLPSESEQVVACTSYASMQTLKEGFRLIGVNEFQHLLSQRGFQPLAQTRRPVPGGKALWLGIFGKDSCPPVHHQAQ